jgi:hypothetical protein
MGILLVACVLAAAVPEIEIRTVTGDSATGTLVELDTKHVVLQTASGRASWDLEKLAGITVRRAGEGSVPGAITLELVDGSTLAVEGFSAENGRAKAKLAVGDAIELARPAIRSVRFAGPGEATAAQWAKIVAAATTSDVLVVKKNNAIDYHKGILHRVTGDAVEFELEGERLPVRRNKVFGLVYHHPSGRELPEPIGTLSDRSGSRWAIRTVGLAGEQIEWTTPAGIKVRRPLADLVRVDFSSGKVVYLSDLKADSVEWVPYFGLGRELDARKAFYAPRQDRNLQSGPLQINGQRYARGLCIPSRTELVYRLPDRYRRLLAIVGIDDSARPQGNVRLVIRGDDRMLFETAVAGTDAPKPIDLDMTGVRRLTVLVDFGDDFDVGDTLNLCEARLLK